MKYALRTRLAQFVGVALALFAGAAVAAALAQTPAGDQPKVAIVLAGPAARQPALIRSAQAAVAHAQGIDAQLRVPRTAADELGVTHTLAAAGYDAVITVGVDRRIAIAPVADRYPRVRFVQAAARGDALYRALTDAAY